MKRVLLLALAAALVLPIAIGGCIGARLLGQSLFEQDDHMREEALSDAMGRTEGSSSRVFLQDTASAEGRYIVRFADFVSEKVILDAFEGKTYELLSDSAQRVFSVYLEDAAAFETQWGASLLYCCRDNVLAAASLTDDPELSDWIAYESLNLPGAWDFAVLRAEVTVAVLDTGVSRLHEDLVGANILDGYDAVAKTAGVFNDTDGHGTAVTGLIAAVANNGVGTAGVAHGVTVLPIRVSNDANRIYSSDLISGIRFAADAGADILNLSFGGYTYSAAEYDAVAYALEKGCILIAAAGNDGETDQASLPIYPAAYDGVVSVGSCNTDGERSAFSQNNASVDILAPGEDLYLLTAERDGYRRDSGTSYSAAIVSGIAALTLSALNAQVRFESAEFSVLLSDGNVRRTGVGYGAVSALEIVQNANRPMIVGVENGKTYTEQVKIRFNRGTALLDGEAFFDGETVYQNGTHALVVTDGDYKKTVHFRLSYTPAAFEMQENAQGVWFDYVGGTAVLDGMPYVSGTLITGAGWHLFALTDSLGETQSRQFYFDGALPSVSGIEDGGVYDTPVSVRLAGGGSAFLDGEPFGNAGLISADGVHELTVTNGNASKTYRFTLQTGVVHYENNLSRSGVIVSEEYGWYAVYSEMLTGIRIYRADGTYSGFIGTETVNGYTFADGLLLIFGEWQLTVLDPAQMAEGDPRVASYSVRCDGFARADGVLYCLADGELYTFSAQDGSMEFVTETDASEIYSDGTALWLYSERENRFDCYLEGEWRSYTARFASAGMRKLFVGDWMFCGGNAVRISACEDVLIPSFSFDGYAVSVAEGRLFSTNGVYRLYDGVLLGSYGYPVACVLSADGGTYVCGLLGGISFYPHGEHKQYGYAPYTGAIHDAPVSGGSYMELIRLYGNARPNAVAAFDDRFGAVFASERVLLLFRDGACESELSLPFSPAGLALDGENCCVWGRDNGLVWYNGMTVQSPKPVRKAFFAMGELYLLCEETLCVFRDGAVVETDHPARDAAGTEEFLAWQYDGVLFVQLGDEAPLTLLGEEALCADGAYLFCGKKLYLASELRLITQLQTEVLAVGGGLFATENGLYTLQDGALLSAFDASGCTLAAIGKTSGTVFFADRAFTVSRFDFPLAEAPIVQGIPENGLVQGQAVITFDRGTAFLDGNPFENGGTVSQPGVHTLTVVLPGVICRQYTFTVVPDLAGIAFSNTLYRLAAGEGDVLHIRYLPEGTSSVPVVYSVEGDCIRLEADGTFLALREGEAVVTATTADGAHRAVCRILVTASLLRFAPGSGFRVNRESGVLLGVRPGTTAESLITSAVSEGQVLVSDPIVKTGTVVTLLSADGLELDRLTVALAGDLDRDGYVTQKDLFVLEEKLQSGTVLEAETLFAADLNASGGVTNRDLTVLREKLLFVSETDRLLPALGTQAEIRLFVPSSVCVGETLEVTLYGSDWAEIDGLCGRLVYDPAVLRYENTVVYGIDAQVHARGDHVAYLLADLPDSSGVLLTVRFTVLRTASNSVLCLRDGVSVSEEGVWGIKDTAAEISSVKRVYGDFWLEIDGMYKPFSPDETELDVYVPLGTPALDYRLQYPADTQVTVRNTVFSQGDTLTALFLVRGADQKITIYTVHAYRTDTPPRYVDTRLESLVIDEIALLFEPDVFDYTLCVPYEIESLTLSWETRSDGVTVDCGDTALQAGKEHTITVTVTAENGEQSVYTLTVFRETAVVEESSGEASSEEETSSVSAESGAESETVSAPQPKRTNYFVWLIPACLLIVGSGIIVGMIRHEKKHTEKE